MEKKSNGLSFIVCCNEFGWTRCWGISRGRFHLALVLLATLLVGGLFSFFLSYSLYGEAEYLRAQKETEINELLDAVDAMSQDIIVDKRLEDKFVKRVLRLEKKVASMERKISTKRQRKTPAMGGRGFRTGDIGHDYFDALEKDIDRLSLSMEPLPFGRPVSGNISSGYGYRKSPFSDAREFHGGIDFRGEKGTEAVATADGVVDKAKWVKGYGKCVVIKHEKGYKTLYAHLSKIEVKKGQKVVAGEKIGEIGSTGRASGPHLHYEIIKHGTRVNPRKYIR